MRIVYNLILALLIKFKMFGVPIAGPTNILHDNTGVVKNTSIPKLTLSKKQNSINDHIVRQLLAAGIMRVAKEDLGTNLADALTTLVPYLQKQETIWQVLWDY